MYSVFLFFVPQHDDGDVNAEQFIQHNDARKFIGGDGVFEQIPNGDGAIQVVDGDDVPALFYFIISHGEPQFFARFIIFIYSFLPFLFQLLILLLTQQLFFQ